jgi:hypothetical protein
MVVCDRNTSKAAFTAGVHQLRCIHLAVFLTNAIVAVPIGVTGRMDLQVTTKIMCSLIHLSRAPRTVA